MEEIDQKMKLKKFFFKKIGGWFAPHNANGAYPRPALFFQRWQAWPPFLRALKRTIKKPYTLYIYVRTRARRRSCEKAKQKTHTAL